MKEKSVHSNREKNLGIIYYQQLEHEHTFQYYKE